MFVCVRACLNIGHFSSFSQIKRLKTNEERPSNLFPLRLRGVWFNKIDSHNRWLKRFFTTLFLHFLQPATTQHGFVKFECPCHFCTCVCIIRLSHRGAITMLNVLRGRWWELICIWMIDSNIRCNRRLVQWTWSEMISQTFDYFSPP